MISLVLWYSFCIILIIIPYYLFKFITTIMCIFYLRKFWVLCSNKVFLEGLFEKDKLTNTVNIAIKAYLFAMYMIVYNFSLNYAMNLFTYCCTKVNLFLKNNNFIFNFIYTRKHL